MPKTATHGRMGRPRKPEADKYGLVHVRLPKPMIRDIDALCARRPDRPDRSQAIRDLLAKGLAVGA